MNPQFKIHGQERKNLKKVLLSLKQSLNGIISEHDINQFYGISYPQYYMEKVNTLKKDIEHLETILSEKYETAIY